MQTASSEIANNGFDQSGLADPIRPRKNDDIPEPVGIKYSNGHSVNDSNRRKPHSNDVTSRVLGLLK